MEQDPVCGMYMIKIDESLTSEYEGTRYYFCCPCCKEMFDLNPERFSVRRDKTALERYQAAKNGEADYD